jgi:hypothetical protein
LTNHDSRTTQDFLATGCDWFDGAPIGPLTVREP